MELDTPEEVIKEMVEIYEEEKETLAGCEVTDLRLVPGAIVFALIAVPDYPIR